MLAAMNQRFRETLWFKKGEMDASAAEHAATDPDVHDKADSLPIEDRYADDGSVSAADTASFGLHTGGTRWLEKMRLSGDLQAHVLVREMKRQRRVYIAMIAAAVAVCGVVLAIFV